MKRFLCLIVLLLSVFRLASQTMVSPRSPAETRRMQQPDLFLVGLRISSDFDDNALYDNANRHSRTFTRMEPRLTWNLFQPRLKWRFDYRPGLSWNYGLTNYTYLSHLLETNLNYSLTKRLKLGLHSSFLKSRDPFDQLRDSNLPQAEQVPEQRSDAFIAPAAGITRGEAALDLSYASASHTTMGASGLFSRVKYDALVGLGQQITPGLEDARSIGGRAFYSHHLTRSQWTGFEYNIQSLSSQAAQSQYLVQSLLYVHKLGFGSKKALSLLAGPERSAVLGSSFLPQKSNWAWAGVATYSWTGAPTSLVAALSHRISDGGLLGPVRLSGGSAELRHKFAARWTADFLVAYNRSRTVGGVPSRFSNASAAAGITRAVNENLSLEIRYWRIQQSTSSARAAAYLADHNRLSVALTYDLKNPLGR